MSVIRWAMVVKKEVGRGDRRSYARLEGGLESVRRLE
jgi:hypothetical protein